MRKNYLSTGRSLLLCRFTNRAMKLTVIILGYHCYKLENVIKYPYIDEIVGDHQCGFRRNRSTTDQIFCIRQVLERKWEYNEIVHHLFMDFKKIYDSVRKKV
jgi:hypothetical protein